MPSTSFLYPGYVNGRIGDPDDEAWSGEVAIQQEASAAFIGLGALRKSMPLTMRQYPAIADQYQWHIVQGIEVEIRRYQDLGLIRDERLQFTLNRSELGPDESIDIAVAEDWADSYETKVYGGPQDTWNVHGIHVIDIPGIILRYEVRSYQAGTTSIGRVDYVRVKVYHNAPPTLVYLPISLGTLNTSTSSSHTTGLTISPEMSYETNSSSSRAVEFQTELATVSGRTSRHPVEISLILDASVETSEPGVKDLDVAVELSADAATVPPDINELKANALVTASASRSTENTVSLEAETLVTVSISDLVASRHIGVADTLVTLGNTRRTIRALDAATRVGSPLSQYVSIETRRYLEAAVVLTPHRPRVFFAYTLAWISPDSDEFVDLVRPLTMVQFDMLIKPDSPEIIAWMESNGEPVPVFIRAVDRVNDRVKAAFQLPHTMPRDRVKISYGDYVPRM